MVVNNHSRLKEILGEKRCLAVNYKPQWCLINEFTLSIERSRSLFSFSLINCRCHQHIIGFPYRVDLLGKYPQTAPSVLKYWPKFS